MRAVDYARELAEAGYFVYPASVRLDGRGKKQPSVPGSWQKGSTRDIDSLEWSDGVIVDTEKSGIVVIDIDVHGEINGFQALNQAGIQMSPTPMIVDTWSGGKHYFYRQPEADPLPCSQGNPVLGVDIRGLGGIVFGAGTLVLNQQGELAGEYTTEHGIIPVAQLPVLPPEFAAEARKGRAEYNHTKTTLLPFTGSLSEHQARVLEQWLIDDLSAVSNATDGMRQAVLSSMTPKIVDRASKLGYRFDDIEVMVREAYELSGGTEWEAKRGILDWAAEKVAAEPLGVPEDYADPDEIRFEEAVRERLNKIRIEQEAKKRAAQDRDPVDLGRELDFDEPPDGLHGKFWVDGVVPMGETVLLFGERNVGKSFVAVDLGLSVATGRRWHGRTVTQGRVLYLAGEGANGLPARRRSWASWNCIGSTTEFRLRDAIVHLNNPASLAAWQKVIVEHEIDLVIIDTVRRAARGLELESPGDAQEAIELMDDLRSVRHGCTVLALGHPTKTDPLQPAGAGTVQDALPMIHRLSKTGEGAATVVDMHTTKSKDGPTGRLASFVHRIVGDSLVFVDHGPQQEDDRRRREEYGL